MRIAYTISTWNGARLVETIKTVPTGDRLLIVDNSVTGWSLSKSWNYSLKRLAVDEGYDAVVVMNDDILMPPGTGEKLANALLTEQYERGVKPELLITTGRNWRDKGAEALKDAEMPEWEAGPDFSLFCTTRRLLERVGGFDEAFVGAYFEDNDMHRRIRLAGYEGVAVTPYLHYGSSTIAAANPQRRAEIQRAYNHNQMVYIRKWGGMPGQEQTSRPGLQSVIEVVN